MPKILSQSGVSLADAYDIEGSIAGIEDLQSREVSLVHEMGQTMFAERFSGQIFRQESAAIAQSTTFNVILTNLPDTPSRILGVRVLVDASAHTSGANVNVRDALRGQELPIWMWDGSAEPNIRIVDDGQAVATSAMLQPQPALTLEPNLLTGAAQAGTIDQVALRGTTSGFGAGTVTYTLLLYLAFAKMGGVSSRGLPLPGW